MAKSDGRKKTNTKRKTSGKKSTSKKSAKNKQISFADIIFKKEFTATLTFVCGLILLIIALFSGGAGSVWNNLHNLYFGLFGICGYYMPLAVLFFGVLSLLNKQIDGAYAKAGEVFFVFIMICAFLHVNNFADTTVEFADSLKNVFASSKESGFEALGNGGAVGAIFGGAIFHMCKSKAVANIILGLVLIADLMLLFGISLMKVFMQMEKPAKRVGELTEETIERSKKERAQRQTEREERRREKQAEKEKATIEEKHRKPEKKSRNTNVDPAGIINDFCDKSKKIEDTAVEEVSVNDNEPSPVEPDIFSLSIVQMKMSDSVIDDTDEDLTEVEAPVADNSPKKEAVKPLSVQEEKELNETLDNAVSQNLTIHYTLPPLDCLKKPKEGNSTYNEDELRTNGDKLIAALNSFNVNATIVGVVPGPSVTRYELAPAPGVKISKFVGLADDLALHMAAPAGLRIEAPIPNKAAIGIEIPNRNKTTVTFRETIDNDKFRSAPSKLTVALGKDIAGSPMFSNLSKMPHLLVAGTTGSGKSVCLNSMIVSILYNATPDEVKLLLIDPKQVEFGIYNGLPHLLVPVVSDPRKAAGALGWAVTEMLSRYKTLNANGVRDIAAYNSLCDERDDLQKMPHIVIFIDELADLMTVAPSEVEDSIQRLAQMARAAGMHLVVATQRPSVDVITGVIKSNIPSRIALTVKSFVDSKIIIDTGGAEKLMGNGDMLYYPVGVPKPVRIQGCYLSDAEIENVVQFIRANSSANYDDTVQQEIDRQAVSEKKKTEENTGGGVDSGDDLLMRAIELFVSAPEKASISALQRHLGLGFAKAGRLMDTLEQKGIVGPHMGSKPRNVLVTKAQWYEMNSMSQTDTSVNDNSTDNNESNGED